ncbi:hypothetical protein KM043_017800 [Ampulex compressa]|nr:hypothetical protein KM043_017800 [Ampulex compressa]
MDTVVHLWNVNRFITSLKCQQSRNLQTFYIQSCRNMGDRVELPKQHFGPSAMCIYCGSLWHTMNYKIRILPGKKMSKSIKRLSRRINTFDETVPKIRRELVQKCIRNEMNKLVIKCSVCLQNTEIPLAKPERQKLPKKDVTPVVQPQYLRQIDVLMSP